MYDHQPAPIAVLDTYPRAFPNAPRGAYAPLALDADCPWRIRQSTRRTSAAVKIGTWVLLGLLAFLVTRVLMSR
jgi:hypothetical protein